MESTRDRVDVVIVGAGPTGLMLGLELALRGISVRVLERLSAPDEAIKAGGIRAPTAEALARRGLAQAMDAEEQRAVAARARRPGPRGSVPSQPRKIAGHFGGLFLIDQSLQTQPERRSRLVDQQALERMLASRAQALGVDVRRGCELLDFRDAGDAVDLEVGLEGGASARLRCAYLVGCDGGRSRVRKRAGFEFSGTEPTLTGHQAIVELNHPEKLSPPGWRRTATGTMAFYPGTGRLFLAEFDGPPADRDAPVTREALQRSLRRVSGTDVTITELKSATRYTDHARQATTYRRGRVFLAGDAAHVHAPFGGQGLNLGVLDAVNLGWKLAATLGGWAAPELLESYTAERHPVAAAVLANTRAQAALMRPDPLTTELREIVARLMAIPECNRFFGEMLSGTATRYDLGDAHPAVGTVAADRALATGNGATLFDRMQDGRGVLLDAGDGAAEELAARWARRVNFEKIDAEESMLIRPDGCIAWARPAGTLDGLEEALERWFGPPGVA